MSDRIAITGLELWTHIGVPQEERAKEQRLLVNITMNISLKNAGQKDDIKETIDYYQVSLSTKKLAKKKRKTIEALAEDIASMILTEYHPDEVTVEIEKFIVPNTQSVSVIIKRKKEGQYDRATPVA